MIYFYSGRNTFGGATYILSRIVELLNAAGTEAYFHGEHPWFMDLSPHNRIGWPNLRPEDSLVCHMYAPFKRQNVRKTVIALHEERFPYPSMISECSRCGGESITEPARGGEEQLDAICRICWKRSAVPQRLEMFDHVVFSSEAHQAKSFRLQPFWGDSHSVIGNPVDVPFTWKPPALPTAGIIGAVVPRKQVALSIQMARAAGFKRVLIYGPANETYFEQHVAPSLGDGVEYVGPVDDREEMYNSISEVFHYSRFEQACMVQGECKKLGIPFHCDEEATPDWHLFSDAEIVQAWQELLQ